MSGPDPEAQAAARRALFELATAFRGSSILFAALELDVFSVIPRGGAGVEHLAPALDVDADPLRLLLNALTGMGLLERRDERYLVPAMLVPLLTKGPDHLVNYLLLHQDENAHWLEMSSALKGTRAAGDVEIRFLDSPMTVHYLNSILANNVPNAKRVVAHVREALPQLEHALDLGGGHGYYAQRLVECYDDVRVTIMDLPRAIEYCRRRLGDHPRFEQIELMAGDALALEAQGSFDLVMMNDLLHYFGRQGKQELVGRAVRALRRGGTLAVSKLRLAPDGVTPAASALFSLRMFVNMPPAFLETDAELVGLLEQAGVTAIRAAPVDDARILLTAVRP